MLIQIQGIGIYSIFDEAAGSVFLPSTVQSLETSSKSQTKLVRFEPHFGTSGGILYNLALFGPVASVLLHAHGSTIT